MSLLLAAACLVALASQTSSTAVKTSEASFPAHYFDRSTPPLTIRHVPSTEGDLHPPPPPLGRHSRLHHPVYPPSSLRRRPSQGGETAPPYAVQMEPLVKYSPRDPLYESGSEESKEEAKGTEPPQRLDAEADLEGGAATLHVAEDKAGHHFPTEEPRRGQYSFPHYGPPQFPQGPRYVILREPEPIIEIIVKESNHTLPAPVAPSVIPPKPREPVHVFYVKYERKKGKSGGERVVFDPPVAANAPTSPEPLPPVHIPEETEARSIVTPVAAPVPIAVETTTLRAVIHPESETVHHPHSRAPTLRVTFREEKHHKKDGEVVEEEQSAPQPSFAAPSWGGPSQIPPFRQLPEQHFRGHQGASRYFGPAPQQQEFQQQGQFPQQHQGQSPDSRAFPPLTRLPSQHYAQGIRGSQNYPPYRPDIHQQQQQALLRQQQLQQFQQQQHQQKHPLQFQDQHKQHNQQFQRLPTQQPPRIPPYHPQHSNPTQSPQYFSSSVAPFVRLQHGDRFPESSGSHSPGGDIVKSITHSEQHQFQSPPSQGQFLNAGHQSPNLHSTDQQLVRHNQPNVPSNLQQQQQQKHPQQQQNTQQQQHAQQQQHLQQQQHAQQQQHLQQQQHAQQQQHLQQQQHAQQQQHLQQQQHAQQQQHLQQQHLQQHFLRHPAEGAQATTNRPRNPVHSSTPIPTKETHNHFASRPNNGAVQYHQQQSTITPSPASRPQLGTTIVPHSKDSPNTIKQINSLSHAGGQQGVPNTTPQPPSSTPETTTRKLPDLPDEIPDDLKQHLLTSGILDNADIQILDYDKVGDIPIESLPPEALAGLQGAASENKPVTVKAPKSKDPVEMKVVRYTPGNEESAVDGLIREDVEETRVLAPVTTSQESEESEEGFRRYLPLRISGERFPVPDVPELRGRNVTSVVVLAPVGFPDSVRGSRAEERSDEWKAATLDRLNVLVKKPSEENFKEWLETEKKASAEEQAVVLLVSPKEGQPEEKGDIFMYDVGSGQVSQLRGELSAAFVRVAKENATER